MCAELPEPLNKTFGRISIFSSYRSPSVNQTGDANGNLGATISIVIPWFADQYENGAILAGFSMVDA
jgi:hypothetical protein